MPFATRPRSPDDAEERFALLEELPLLPLFFAAAVFAGAFLVLAPLRFLSTFFAMVSSGRYAINLFDASRLANHPLMISPPFG
jgi:hypothetical protein